MLHKINIPTFKTTQQLTVCSYKNFEPVIYDQGLGFEADLLKAIATLWDIKIIFVPTDDYDDIWEKPGEKNSIFDLTAAGLDPSCHQSPNTHYSVPTAEYSQSLLILKKHFPNKINNFLSFKNDKMKIGVLGNTSGETYGHQRAKNQGISIEIFKRYDSELDLINALNAEEIYAIARGTIGNEYQELQNNKYMTIEQKSFGEKLAYAIDPLNTLLRESINEAIELITLKNKNSYKAWLDNPNIFMETVAKI